jgi:hypothetical protein
VGTSRGILVAGGSYRGIVLSRMQGGRLAIVQHKTDEDLRNEMREAIKRVDDHWDDWKHTKSGNIYKLVRVAFEEATLSLVVCYYRANDPALCFTRPLDEFLAKFEKADK